MTKEIRQNINKGINAFQKNANKKKKMYLKLLKLAKNDQTTNPVWMIKDQELFNKTISLFGAALDTKKAEYKPETIYEIGIHKITGTLIIGNKGATLYSHSPKKNTPHLIRHIGFCLYVPGLGIEFVNVGLVGDVYNGKVVLRSESACTPSFLFGSQRCNCAHQWDVIRETAASFNPVTPPSVDNGKDFEAWVQEQLTYDDKQHTFNQNGQGFIMMHLDTQNGMGSGYTKNQFSFDLYTKASMRHRGEYSSEQIHKTTMAGGFRAIGLDPDPRQNNNRAGYNVTFTVLDFLNTSKELIFLSNNPFKVDCLEKNGYQITRVPLMGEINLAGAQEAKERGEEFEHLDICDKVVSFEDELENLKSNINKQINL